MIPSYTRLHAKEPKSEVQPTDFLGPKNVPGAKRVLGGKASVGRAMKLLIVASTFPASDTDPVPAFVKDQAIAFKKTYPEMNISVLAPHDARSQTQDFTQQPAYKEYRFHYLWPRRWEKLAGRGILPQLAKNPLYYLAIPFFFIGEYMALKRLVRREKPDVIYAHWFTPQGVVAGMVSRKTKVPYVITTHAADVAVWKKFPFGKYIVRHYIQQAAAITAVSPRTLAKLQYFFSESQWKQLKNKVKIIPMGVFPPSSPVLLSTKGQNILFIGRLAEKKGVQYLLPAFARIASDFLEATLTIAGDGPLLDSLKAQAKQLKIPEKQLHFAGYISGDKKQTYIEKADIYVVPSIITESGDAEGLPVALMEGLAAGKICVATNESGADAIIEDGKSGFLLPEKDSDTLAESLEKALTLSPEARRDMQVKATEAAEQFDWEHVARAHYEFLFKQVNDVTSP